MKTGEHKSNVFQIEKVRNISKYHLISRYLVLLWRQE